MSAEQEEPDNVASTQPLPAGPENSPRMLPEESAIEHARMRYRLDLAMGRGAKFLSRLSNVSAKPSGKHIRNEEREVATAEAFATLRERLNSTVAQMEAVAEAVQAQQDGLYVDRHINAANVARMDLGRALTLLEEAVQLVEKAQARVEGMHKNPFADGKRSAEGDLMVKKLLVKKAIKDAFNESDDGV